MLKIFRIAALASCLLLQAHPAGALIRLPNTSRQQEERSPVTILVSIDGFRADYLDRGETPVLSRLAAGGVHAAMRPSFPSKTFPNHWALVTGKVPDHNGVVGNSMRDPERPGETFTMGTDDPFWWDEASPIWVEAERAGIRSATMFWPGSNVAWGGAMSHHIARGGVRPSDWEQFNQAVTGEQRVNTVLDWLRRPSVIRPKLVTLYFDTVDSAGHSYGPDAPETDRAIAEIDGQIGRLVDGLTALGQPANLVIVADHGMAATSADRVIRLDTIADRADFETIETGTYAAIYPVPGHEAALEKSLLRSHDHLQCWARAQIPARFHYGANPRVAPYLCLADVGWSVFDKPPHGVERGNHGYDNAAPEMAALFLANGPAFARGITLPSFDNVDVDPLLRDLIGLPPSAGLDGNDAPFRSVLRSDR